MRNILILSLVVLGLMAPPVVSAQPPHAGIQAVLEKYRDALPAPEDLTVYTLDWVSALDEAKTKAAREKRPILLIVVTNSYGNMYTGHC